MIVTAHPHLRRNPFRRKKRQKKSIFIYRTTCKKYKSGSDFQRIQIWLEQLLTKTKKELRQAPSERNDTSSVVKPLSACIYNTPMKIVNKKLIGQNTLFRKLNILPRHHALVALYFIMADYNVVASAPAPSSHCRSRRHRCHRFVIVTTHPHLRRKPFRRKKRQKKSIFIYGIIFGVWVHFEYPIM
jgi:hypothetical protein